MAMTPKQMLALATKKAEGEQQPADDEKDKEAKPAEEPKKDKPAEEPAKDSAESESESESENEGDDKKADPVAASWDAAIRCAGMKVKDRKAAHDPWKR